MLIKVGHREGDIADYAFDKFELYIESAIRVFTSDRISYVVDTSAVVAGSFSKSKLLKEHIENLQEVIKDGN